MAITAATTECLSVAMLVYLHKDFYHTIISGYFYCLIDISRCTIKILLLLFLPCSLHSFIISALCLCPIFRFFPTTKFNHIISDIAQRMEENWSVISHFDNMQTIFSAIHTHTHTHTVRHHYHYAYCINALRPFILSISLSYFVIHRIVSLYLNCYLNVSDIFVIKTYCDYENLLRHVLAMVENSSQTITSYTQLNFYRKLLRNVVNAVSWYTF